MPNYFKTSGGVLIAAIGKCASTTLSKALLDQHFPKCLPVFLGAPIGDGPGWQASVPTVSKPEAMVLIPVRDPIERFRSACVQNRRTNVTEIDELLDLLEAGNDRFTQNFHLVPVIAFTEHDQSCKLYKFPDHLDELASEAGLVLPLPLLNSARVDKPVLTQQQQRRVGDYYADDIDLFHSIESPGMDYVSHL